MPARHGPGPLWRCIQGESFLPPFRSNFCHLLALQSAFSCFVNSKEEEKGSDCVSAFSDLHKCFDSHPEIFNDAKNEEQQSKDNEAQQEAVVTAADSPSTSQENVHHITHPSEAEVSMAS